MTQLTPNEPAPFEHLQPVADQLLAELTERLYLSRESAPGSYHALANSLTMALLRTHDPATGDGTTISSQRKHKKLTAPLVWMVKRLLTDPTYRAAQLVIHREKLKKCYYTAPRLFVAKPPAWLPASAYLTARADLDHYPRNSKWWESDHWLTVEEPELRSILASRLDHLLKELTRHYEVEFTQPHPVVFGQSGSGVASLSKFNERLNEIAHLPMRLVVSDEEREYYSRPFEQI